MFAEAVSTAARYTFPYVGLRLRRDGGVHTLAAAFMVINDEGWIVTSAHIVEELLASQRSAGDAESGSGGIAQRSEVWAVPGFSASKPSLVGGRVSPVSDLATGRLEPFDRDVLSAYPVFRDTAVTPLRQGESVCRYGFPFHSVAASFSTDSGGFQVDSGGFPVPSFALDGIVARFNRRHAPDGASALFVETSSPGLRGQSGGPLLDVAGRVCGVQSHTAHLDLGFDASFAGEDGRTVTERQFLNVGFASHVDEVRALLDADGVSYLVG